MRSSMMLGLILIKWVSIQNFGSLPSKTPGLGSDKQRDEAEAERTAK